MLMNNNTLLGILALLCGICNAVEPEKISKPDLHYIVIDRSASIEERKLTAPIIKAVTRYVEVLPVGAEVGSVIFFL